MKLPDIRQKDDHSCGEVAIRVLLRGIGVRYRKDRYPPIPSMIDGLDPRAIETYLRGLGLMVLSGSFTVKDLWACAATDRPVICLVTPDHGVGHYVVVGDVDDNRVSYQDPTHGPDRCAVNRWLKMWHEVDRLGAKYRQWGIAAWRA